MPGNIFNVRDQLVFYGAYHANPINAIIHIFCVPLILWSFFVMGSVFSKPSFFPDIHYVFNDYFTFDFNWAFIVAFAFQAYYIVLQPLAGLSYLPQMTASLLSASSFAQRPDGLRIAIGAHVLSWVMQLLGHGLAEKRSPAFLDNLLGALVLAPFFVWLEVVFALGYWPELHKTVNNGVAVEIARFRRGEAQKKRMKEL